jgi:hypothetical protein
LGHGLKRSLTANAVWRQGVQSYFLSKAPLTAALHYLLTLASILFVIWPKSQYLRIGSPPLTFSIVAIVATLIIAYLSFGYGAGRLREESTLLARPRMSASPRQFQGAVLGLTLLTIAHTCFFVLLALPLLIAAAHVSGITAENFGIALLLIITSTLAYRWLGILALCVWERHEFMRYVVARLAFVVFVLGSAFFLPPLNPLLGLISMTFGEELGQTVLLIGHQLSYAVVSLIIHLLLLLAAYIMVLKFFKSRFRGASALALLGVDESFEG